ncbi:MAG TPA: hypothetical protein VF937_14880 [Chloroflexota bacterium]
MKPAVGEPLNSSAALTAGPADGEAAAATVDGEAAGEAAGEIAGEGDGTGEAGLADGAAEAAATGDDAGDAGETAVGAVVVGVGALQAAIARTVQVESKTPENLRITCDSAWRRLQSSPKRGP